MNREWGLLGTGSGQRVFPPPLLEEEEEGPYESGRPPLDNAVSLYSLRAPQESTVMETLQDLLSAL